jgi:hypothetical protein
VPDRPTFGLNPTATGPPRQAAQFCTPITRESGLAICRPNQDKALVTSCIAYRFTVILDVSVVGRYRAAVEENRPVHAYNHKDGEPMADQASPGNEYDQCKAVACAGTWTSGVR